MVCRRRRRQRITGVSAVPGRRQQVLARLVTDGERRVFGRVPQTGVSLDLHNSHDVDFRHVVSITNDMTFVQKHQQTLS